MSIENYQMRIQRDLNKRPNDHQNNIDKNRRVDHRIDWDERDDHRLFQFFLFSNKFSNEHRPLIDILMETIDPMG